MVGQAAAGDSVGGSGDTLHHGYPGPITAAAEGEGEGGSEGEGEGEGEDTGDCAAMGAPVIALVGEDVCLPLSAGCPVSGSDPLYQWFKDGEVTALVESSHYVGVNTNELCITNVQLVDAGVYTLLYDNGSKAAAQYSVQLIVNTALPASRVLGLLALSLFLAACAIPLAHRSRRKNPGRR